MTGPYSSALLNAPAPAPAPAPASRSVAVPAYAMPVPQYAPAPQYLQAAPPATRRRGSRIESLLLGIVAVVVVVAMAIGGFAMARGTAPSDREYAAAQNIAGYTGFQNGRTTGIQAGRSEAVAEGQRLAQIKSLIARQKQYNKGYVQGRKVGEGQYARRSTGYRSGYRAPTYRSYGGGSNATTSAVSSAIQAAQSYANATGSDVDVEVE